jgi:hypothetical protein
MLREGFILKDPNKKLLDHYRAEILKENPGKKESELSKKEILGYIYHIQLKKNLGVIYDGLRHSKAE